MTTYTDFQTTIHLRNGYISATSHNLFSSYTLKTLTSLNKEVCPFFLGDNHNRSFPFFLPLAITAFGGPAGYFSLVIIAFGAFEFIVPKYYYRS